MNMDSGAYASNSPEAILLRSIQGHMADFYRMPAWFGAGATTAKEPGVQSAYENALAMFTAYAAGADCTFGTGLLDGSRILASSTSSPTTRCSGWSRASCAAST